MNPYGVDVLSYVLYSLTTLLLGKSNGSLCCLMTSWYSMQGLLLGSRLSTDCQFTAGDVTDVQGHKSFCKCRKWLMRILVTHKYVTGNCAPHSSLFSPYASFAPLLWHVSFLHSSYISSISYSPSFYSCLCSCRSLPPQLTTTTALNVWICFLCECDSVGSVI